MLQAIVFVCLASTPVGNCDRMTAVRVLHGEQSRLPEACLMAAAQKLASVPMERGEYPLLRCIHVQMASGE